MEIKAPTNCALRSSTSLRTADIDSKTKLPPRHDMDNEMGIVNLKILCHRFFRENHLIDPGAGRRRQMQIAVK